MQRQSCSRSGITAISILRSRYYTLGTAISVLQMKNGPVSRAVSSSARRALIAGSLRGPYASSLRAFPPLSSLEGHLLTLG